MMSSAAAGQLQREAALLLGALPEPEMVGAALLQTSLPARITSHLCGAQPLPVP